ncbi:hypothetical protein EVAR_77772_1 [Eumeta japonica]|uniref:Uncharacterized protein n=1 Tax=Eumeta variegata TaxID=151549 RepID=A0A4C1TE21_EUMVA|nr:hypothetical protein EVAR_77772_1 [Eumeta japonica]
MSYGARSINLRQDRHACVSERGRRCEDGGRERGGGGHRRSRAGGAGLNIAGPASARPHPARAPPAAATSTGREPRHEGEPTAVTAKAFERDRRGQGEHDNFTSYSLSLDIRRDLSIESYKLLQ